MSTTTIERRFTRSLPLRILIFLAFLLCVNLLAGYIAIKLNYPSLFNVRASFWEYALPLPLSWGLAHVPSMFIYGVPLIFLSRWDIRFIRFFRIACICTFLLLLLELDKKIPFVLFAKVDSISALVFSLVVAPPNQKDNPILVASLKMFTLLSTLALTFYTYSSWKHRTPVISEKNFQNGVFELKSIVVKKDFHKSMVFNVEVKKFLPQNQTCVLAQALASEILETYPFDESYNKIIEVRYNPTVKKPNFTPYNLGEISLNRDDKEKDGSFPCYLKYKEKI